MSRPLPAALAALSHRSTRATRLLFALAHGREARRAAAERLPGTPEIVNEFGRGMSLDEKFAAVDPELRGATRLAREVVHRVIRIRRGVDVARDWLFVAGAVGAHGDALWPDLSSRWIVSILDTYSDHAPPARRLAADAIRNLVLGIRLGESMALQHCADPALADTPQRELFRVELWDNIIHFNYRRGDTYRNLLSRMERNLAAAPELRGAWAVLLTRMASHPPLATALLRNAANAEAFRKATGGP